MTAANQMKHYLLTPYEAELLACYRLLDEETQGAVSHLVGASVEVDRPSLNSHVGLSLVKKGV